VRKRSAVIRRIIVPAALILAAASGGAEMAQAKPPPVSPDTAVTSAGETISANYAESMPGFNGSVGSAATAESAESIIGADQRVRINPTTSYPARAIGVITRNGNQHCTGWLISRDTVLTAGHCVHSGGTSGAWLSGLRFFPARNGTSSPYGSCVPRSGGLTSFVGWVRDRDERHDAGIIKLNCSIGNTVGWFGLWWQAASLTGQFARVQGYPGDHPWTQWLATGNITNTQTYQVFYKNDTVGGESGSPVWRYRSNTEPWCTGACGYAVHAYGLHNGAPHSSDNHATRNTQAKFNVYQSVRLAP
jgi:glutamyl endopeptidase